jgi:hypothetical protein
MKNNQQETREFGRTATIITAGVGKNLLLSGGKGPGKPPIVRKEAEEEPFIIRKLGSRRRACPAVE